MYILETQLYHTRTHARACVTHTHTHTQTDQGIKNIMPDRAGVLAGTEPDYGIQDLFNAIAAGNPVSNYVQCVLDFTIHCIITGTHFLECNYLFFLYKFIHRRSNLPCISAVHVFL